MRKVSHKALYLFLCSILGMVLLTMLHRAIFVLFQLLLMIDYPTYSLGMSPATIAMIDFCTMLVALFLGGWYGTVLGLDWYAMVYGPNADKPARLFHAFMPHHWRGTKSARSNAANNMMPVAETAVHVPVSKKQREWSFDDLLKPQTDQATLEPKKRVTRKPAARKTVRRTAAKRTKIIAE